MSKITEYRKLVRDKVPELLEAKGLKVKVREANHDEFEIELLEKLREEALEFKNAKSISELVDLLETIDAIIGLYEWDKTEIEAAKAQKFTESGSYSKHFILEQTEE